MVGESGNNSQFGQRSGEWIQTSDTESVVTLRMPGSEDQTFTFDQVFGPECTQQAVYESAAEESVADVIRGYNATLLAYGQSGSGKTFTMEGAAFSAAKSASAQSFEGRSSFGRASSDDQLTRHSITSLETVASIKHSRALFRKHQALRDSLNRKIQTQARSLPALDSSETNLGLVPRCVAALFEKIGKMPTAQNFEVKVSYVELYQEKVRDLLVRG